MLIGILASLAIGGAGGAIFYWLHAPLPWMLGSLFATGLFATLGGRWLMPGIARRMARPVVGVLAGSAFTPQLIESAAQWWSAILLLLVFSIAVTCLGYVFFRRVGHTDRATAFFASAPGGLGELTLLGSALGGNVRSLVLVHSIRIVICVFTIPLLLQIVLDRPIGRTILAGGASAAASVEDFAILGACAVAGFIVSRLVRFNAGAMLFPLALSAIVHAAGVTEAAPPPWMVALVQVAIGAVVGGRFSGIRWDEARGTLGLAVAWGAALVALAAAAAVVGAWLVGRPFAAMLLALAPGGMVEMTVITFSLGIEVAFVVTCQAVRILLVLVLIPLAYNLFLQPPPGPGGPPQKPD